MANIEIKDRRAYGYFSFVQGSRFSDVVRIELIASRVAPLDEADVLVDYDAVGEDDFVYETYKPEQILDAMKDAMNYIEANWEEVKLVISLTDEETNSGSHFSLDVCSYWKDERDISFRVGSVLRKGSKVK